MKAVSLRMLAYLLIALCALVAYAPAQAVLVSAHPPVTRFQIGHSSSIPFRKSRGMVVEIGDSSRAVFDPSFTVSLWQGECRFRVRLSTASLPLVPAAPDFKRSDSARMTRLSTHRVEHLFYAVADNALEWRITLPLKPATNRLSFPIQTRRLRFYYQDTLTDYERRVMGAVRPDSVVGSYAVYHDAARGQRMHIIGTDTVAENYGTGKAFHIYRPRAWDASINADTIWCDLRIDPDIGQLTITLPQSYLDDPSRVWPVTIDPTIGNTNAGATQFNLGASFAEAVIGDYLHTAAAGERIVSFHFYGWETGGDGSVAMAAYTVPAATPVTRVAPGVSVSITASSDATKGWHTSSSVSQSLTADTVYAIACAENPGSDVKCYFDNTASRNRQTSTSQTLDDPFPAGNKTNHVMSWYATTTISSGSSPVVSRRRKLIMGGN